MGESVIVHGAAGSIGSSCVEIVSGEEHLILDYGKPLEGDGEVPFVIPKEYSNHCLVLLSHSHQDHYGYVNEIKNDAITIRAAKRTLRAIQLQNPDVDYSFIERKLPVLFLEWHGIRYSFMKVDHSAADAYCIMIITNENAILYTGDFRMHGRISDDFYEDIRIAYTYAHGKPLTVITEATNSGKETGPSETDVEDAFTEEFKQPGLIMVKMANQNLQRLESVFNACKRTGRILVTEPYTALCAKELGNWETHFNIQPDGETWKVFNIKSSWTERMAEEGTLKQFGGKLRISKADMIDYSDRIVAVSNYHMQNYLDKKKLINRVIWSMWDGYPEYEEIKNKYAVKHIHSSGHVYEKDLVGIIEKLNPKRTIIMHSDDPKRVSDILSHCTIAEVAEKDKVVEL